MMKFTTSLLVSSSLLGLTTAECPNACSSHGICTNYDMCQCYRNWMANDCSERVCQFGLAHVDTPKGDLDASSGQLTGPEDLIIPNNEVYPYGTTEQFPNMVDSNGNILANTAHYYMECSNKGICDRSAGTCECFPGYEGSACQRASCPSNEDGECSGHGTCQSIKEISQKDYNNIYELWDKSATLGCVCDAGYYGADCSLRRCKYGADPLYADDSIATPRFANWTFGIFTTAAATITGNYSIVFYDVFGEDWRTDAIQAGSTCPTIIDALERLPNNVIPPNSVLCKDQDTSNTLTGKVPSAPSGTYVYHQLTTLVFPGNVGQLRQIEIDIYLDGPRPTLVSSETTSTLGTFVYANGFHGEFVDYVADYCEGVEVNLDATNFKILVSNAQAILLKRCLGSSDFDDVKADEVYDWDYGDIEYPHLVKFVEATPHAISRICNSTTTYFAPTGNTLWCDNEQPAGFYAPVRYVSGNFLFYNSLNTIYSATTPFRVFTTKGTLQRVNTDYDFRFKGLFPNRITYWSSTGTSTSMDCETHTSSTGTCLNKGDRVMFLNVPNSVASFSAKVPEYHNIYTVKKIGRSYNNHTAIDLDMGINFAHVSGGIFAYKFTPPVGSGSSWAAECSDRGVCDTSSGVCKCFKGYTKDDCSMQNTLAK